MREAQLMGSTKFLLVMWLSAFGLVAHAEACSCGYSTVASRFESSTDVFVGTVLSTKHKTVKIPKLDLSVQLPDAVEVRARLRVEQSWKGPHRDVVEVVTGMSGGMCGVGFEPGDRFLVFAASGRGDSKSTLVTSICSGTHAVSRTADTIDSLGASAWVRGGGGGAKASSDMRVSVAIDHKWIADSGPGFLAGIRRAFQQDSVLLERAGLKAGRADLGKVPNRIKLVPRAGYFQIADRSWFRRVTPDSSRAAEGEEDSLVLIRPGGATSVEVDHVYPRGSAPDSIEEPDIWFLTINVATCAPGRLADSLEWTQLRVHWGERAKTWTRSQEIQGWVVGMAAMQLLYRREGWLPDTVDLVFESRGRNR